MACACVGFVYFAAVEFHCVASAADRQNVVLLCIDDLRPELGCFGKDYIQSPNIDRLASRSRIFRRHYVQAPTCGASRYAMLTGCYGPESNQALFERGRALQRSHADIPTTIPEWYRQHGYRTVSVGKVSHHPGGRGGPDWNDDSVIEMPGAWDRHLMPVGPWKHPRGAMHGLANGEIRLVRNEMDVFQAVVGPDTLYPDGWIAAESLRQLNELEQADSPFCLAIGFIRPHLPFGAPAKYLDLYRDTELPAIPHPSKPAGKTTWHQSGEFMAYDRDGRDPNQDAEFADQVRRHYAACVSFADAQVGKVLDRIDQLGIADQTIVILWGDHGWHLGEHAIWGKHSLFEESLRSPLLISHGELPNPGDVTDAIVESIDLFPTLCQLSNLEIPDSCVGQSLVPQLTKPTVTDGMAVSYTRKAATIRSNTHRFIKHSDGQIELYDHRTADRETTNVASEQSNFVHRLNRQLAERLQRQ